MIIEVQLEMLLLCFSYNLSWPLIRNRLTVKGIYLITYPSERGYICPMPNVSKLTSLNVSNLIFTRHKFLKLTFIIGKECLMKWISKSNQNQCFSIFKCSNLFFSPYKSLFTIKYYSNSFKYLSKCTLKSHCNSKYSKHIMNIWEEINLRWDTTV